MNKIFFMYHHSRGGFKKYSITPSLHGGYLRLQSRKANFFCNYGLECISLLLCQWHEQKCGGFSAVSCHFCIIFCFLRIPWPLKTSLQPLWTFLEVRVFSKGKTWYKNCAKLLKIGRGGLLDIRGCLHSLLDVWGCLHGLLDNCSGLLDSWGVFYGLLDVHGSLHGLFDGRGVIVLCLNSPKIPFFPTKHR